MDAAALMHSIVPVVGMVTGIIAILLPALIVFVVLHFRHKRTERLYETVRKLAELGQPVPPELLDPPAERREAGSPLMRAVTLIGTGIGLGLMFYLMGMKWLVGVGAMLVCIGLAQCLGLWLERSQRRDAATPSA